MMFDHVLIADWSAASRPTSATKRRDSIWVGEAAQGCIAETHFRTRAAAEEWIEARLDALKGRRVLLGFDFAFAWPQGFARALTGEENARGVWDWLAREISDGADNRNNRFEVAAAINARFPGGPGPFWSCPVGLDLPDLPKRRLGIDYAALGLAEHRRAEVETGAKPVWMLCNPGAVGSQSLMGQRFLSRLCRRPGAHVWALGGAGWQDAPLVLAEVYPSLLAAEVAALVQASGMEKDRAQVRLLALALAGVAEGGQMAALMGDLPGVARDEGWILGVGRVHLLRNGLEAGR